METSEILILFRDLGFDILILGFGSEFEFRDSGLIFLNSRFEIGILDRNNRFSDSGLSLENSG